MAKVKKPDKASRIVIPGPDDLNEPPSDLFAYTTLIFGEKGIGKTSLLAQIPNCVVVMLEPLRKNLRIRQLALDSWEGLIDFAEQLKDDSSVEVVALDTFDRVYQLASDYECSLIGIKDPNEANDYGNTWRNIKARVEAYLKDLASYGKGITLTSHAKWKEVELRSGKKREILVPTMPDAAWGIVKAMADFAFYYGFYGSRRALYLRGHEQLWSACGSNEHFLDPNGNPVKTILLGEDPSEAFTTFQASFNNEVEGVDDEDEETLTTLKRPWKKKKKEN